MRRTIVMLVLVSLGFMWAACGNGRSGDAGGDQPVRVVHANLSDLFVSSAPPDSALSNTSGDDALRALIRWAGSGEDVDAEALVLVGTLQPVGADAAAAAKRLFDALRDAPAAPPIYSRGHGS